MKRHFFRGFSIICILSLLLSGCLGFGHHRGHGPKGHPRHEGRKNPGPKHHPGPGPKHHDNGHHKGHHR